MEKGKALEAAGIPALPGVGHWDTLASWAPAGAGALFFGLSLGLGAGALATGWAAGSRTLPGRWGSTALWVLFLAPLWALRTGDPGLAAALFGISLGAIAACWGPPEPDSGRPGLQLTCFAVVALGLVPWARAPEGAFTRIRDRLLLGSAPGLAVNRFYYRWTLYPAEALKPLALLSQPTAVLPQDAPPPVSRAFCREALALQILCVPSGSRGADLEVRVAGGALRLARSGAEVPWPRDAAGQSGAWLELSRSRDPSRPLRTATAWSLFVGCPLALVVGLGSLCVFLGRRFRDERLRMPGTLLLSALLAAGLGLLGAPGKPLPEPPATLETLRQGLESADPARRFHAVRRAWALGPAAAPVLLRALEDPVINVRYGAAEALGASPAPGVAVKLLAVLESPEEWYVKERAYASLWRLGWRPGVNR